jgi:hypothetical protein
MSNNKVTVLDVLARIENLERENDSLKKEVDDLKTQLAAENWQELIIYRPIGVHNNKPLEISWSEIDDEAKRTWYRDGDPAERDVIGLVRKAKS